MPDVETTFAELQARCARTIAFVEGVDPAALSAEREVELKFPNGMGYRFSGQAYLTGFALPNFFFHVTTAYGILRSAGVGLGKIGPALRAALTAGAPAPDLSKTLAALGREESLGRLDDALSTAS